MKKISSTQSRKQFVDSLNRMWMGTIRNFFFILIIALALLACEKESNDSPAPPTLYDQSLILSRGSGAKLVLTNPVDGQDLYVQVWLHFPLIVSGFGHTG